MLHQVPENATEQERVKIYNRNLNENPGIAAHWSQKRWELFVKHVLKKKRPIVDWCNVTRVYLYVGRRVVSRDSYFYIDHCR